MQFQQLIREYALLDIVTVDGQHYALSAAGVAVPGCVPLAAALLGTRMREFLSRGYSERHRQPYASTLGMASWALYTYSLEQLPPTRKQMFSHALMGVGSKPGMLERWQGQKLGRSAFFIPVAQTADVDAFLTRWGVPHTREVILRGA